MVEEHAGGTVARATAGTGAADPVRPVGPVDPAAGSRPDRVRRVVGTVLVLGWAAWLVCALLALPRPVSAGTLEQDLAAGRVVSWHAVALLPQEDSLFQWVDRRDAFPVAPGSEVDPPERRTVGYLVDDALGRYRVVDVTDLGDELALRMEGSGVPRVQPAWDRPGTVVPPDVERWAALGLGLAGFLLVVGGPQPTRGTRWFWFWLLGLPAGTGVLALVALEVLRPLRARVPWAPPRRSLRGWQGLGILLVGGILLAGGLDALGSWLGPAWTLPR